MKHPVHILKHGFMLDRTKINCSDVLLKDKAIEKQYK